MDQDTVEVHGLWFPVKTSHHLSTLQEDSLGVEMPVRVGTPVQVWPGSFCSCITSFQGGQQIPEGILGNAVQQSQLKKLFDRFVFLKGFVWSQLHLVDSSGTAARFG